MLVFIVPAPTKGTRDWKSDFINGLQKYWQQLPGNCRGYPPDYHLYDDRQIILRYRPQSGQVYPYTYDPVEWLQMLCPVCQALWKQGSIMLKLNISIAQDEK